MDSQQISVAGLSWNTSESDLYQLFSTAGTVAKVKVVTNSDGESLGVAIVTMATAKQAAKAVEELHGSVLDGRTIKLTFEKSEQQRMTRMLLASF